MAELADAADSKSADLRVLGVRLPLPAPTSKTHKVIGLALRMRSTRAADAADFSPIYNPTSV
jgi:hypothetical protein